MTVDVEQVADLFAETLCVTDDKKKTHDNISVTGPTQGHTDSTIPLNTVLATAAAASTATATKAQQLKTEDTGKVFEKAICMRYGIDYVGHYKYGDERPKGILPLLAELPSMFPTCVHTAEKGSPFDFTTTDGSLHLSAKTCKRGKAKVAPQVFGQCSVEKLCGEFGWTETADVAVVKRNIQENVASVLSLFEKHTFGCDTIYFNEKRRDVKYIKHTMPIDWASEGLEFKWTKSWESWNNSSTLKVRRTASGGIADGNNDNNKKLVPILEIQFHSSGRKNMANRWVLENVISLFPEAFNVTTWSS